MASGSPSKEFNALQRAQMTRELLAAAARGDEKIIDMCLKKGADISAQDSSGKTPLMLAFDRLANFKSQEALSFFVAILEHSEKEGLFLKDKQGRTVFDYLVNSTAPVGYINSCRKALIEKLDDLAHKDPPAAVVDMRAEKEMIVQPLKLRTPEAKTASNDTGDQAPPSAPGRKDVTL